MAVVWCGVLWCAANNVECVEYREPPSPSRLTKRVAPLSTLEGGGGRGGLCLVMPHERRRYNIPSTHATTFYVPPPPTAYLTDEIKLSVYRLFGVRFFCSATSRPASLQELSGGHALWYTGTLTLYHYNYVGVFNINPAVRIF